jgi:hypothetical protein
MLSLSTEHQNDFITFCYNTLRYDDYLFKIATCNNHFTSLVNKLYTNELQINKANTSEKQASFLDIYLSIDKSQSETTIRTVGNKAHFNLGFI